MKLPIIEFIIIYLLILNGKLLVSVIPITMNEVEKIRAEKEKIEEARLFNIRLEENKND
jgi:hypothetical protein